MYPFDKAPVSTNVIFPSRGIFLKYTVTVCHKMVTEITDLRCDPGSEQLGQLYGEIIKEAHRRF